MVLSYSLPLFLSLPSCAFYFVSVAETSIFRKINVNRTNVSQVESETADEASNGTDKQLLCGLLIPVIRIPRNFRTSRRPWIHYRSSGNKSDRDCSESGYQRPSLNETNYGRILGNKFPWYLNIYECKVTNFLHGKKTKNRNRFLYSSPAGHKKCKFYIRRHINVQYPEPIHATRFILSEKHIAS